MVTRKKFSTRDKYVLYGVGAVIALICYGTLKITEQAYMYCAETHTSLVCSSETKKWIGKYIVHLSKKLF